MLRTPAPRSRLAIRVGGPFPWPTLHLYSLTLRDRRTLDYANVATNLAHEGNSVQVECLGALLRSPELDEGILVVDSACHHRVARSSGQVYLMNATNTAGTTGRGYRHLHARVHRIRCYRTPFQRHKMLGRAHLGFRSVAKPPLLIRLVVK